MNIPYNGIQCFLLISTFEGLIIIILETVLISIGIVFLVIGVEFLLEDIYTILTTRPTFSMQIYNYALEEWESITFDSSIKTPIRGIIIIIIGIFPLVLGMVWKLMGSEFNISVQN